MDWLGGSPNTGGLAFWLPRRLEAFRGSRLHDLLHGLWCCDEQAPDSQPRYMRPVAYASVQGVYAFVFIGVLRTAFDIAAAWVAFVCCGASSV